MPYVRIEANRRCQTAVSELQRQVTSLVHERKGDPVSMISTVVLAEVPVSFGGDPAAPAAILTLTNAVMPPEITAALVPELTRILGEAFGVPPDRMYLFFHEYREAHLVGWNGKTFDAILAQDAKPSQGATP